MSLQPGTKVGPYEVVAPLGEGGMGEVFRAKDDRLSREVALKVLSDSVAEDPDRMRRFEQEARAAGTLNHPNVVVVYDFGSHDGRSFLVTELLDGQNLRERLSEGPLPIRKAIEAGIQIAHGLAAAHARGIVHRDLKPENLFLTREGRVKILDFGVARHVDAASPQGTLALTGSGAVMGTAGYMSPEQVRGQSADHRSDIFAFGAVLYELLSGKRAFGGQSHVERGYAILNSDPEPLSHHVPELPAATIALVNRCLEKNPEERFQSARDLGFALEALAQLPSEPVPPLPPPPSRPSRRALLWGGAAFAGTALFGAGVLTGRSSGKQSFLGVRSGIPTFTRIIFRPSRVTGARFSPDGGTLLFSAAFNDQEERIYSALPGIPELRPLTPENMRLSGINDKHELALLRTSVEIEVAGEPGLTLARMPLSGSAARDVTERVEYAEWGPGGELLVTRRNRDGATIEFPIGKEIFRTDGWISFPKFSPDGTRIAFAHHPVLGDDRGWIEVIDPKGGDNRRLIDEWYTVKGLAWSPAGNEVWFTGSREVVQRIVHAVNLEGRTRVVMNAPGNYQLWDVSGDGRALITRAATRNRMIAFVPGQAEERELSWFDASVPRDLTPDGSMLLFDEGAETSRGDYDVYVRPTDGSPAVRVGRGMSRAISPDGKWVVLSRAPTYDDLVLVPTGAGTARDLSTRGISDLRDAWFFRDGRRILIHGRNEARVDGLWILDLDAVDPVKVYEGAIRQSGPPSEDGKLAPVVTVKGESLLVPLDGGEPRSLPLKNAAVVQWSADGKLYIGRSKRLSRIIDLSTFDPETGAEELFAQLRVPDGTLINHIRGGAVAVNGAYVYTYAVANDELHVAEGLR